MTLKSVKVPPHFEGLFEQAETDVGNYFKKLNLKPENGTIDINGERYLLVRAESMSVMFLEFIRNMYPSIDDQAAITAVSKMLYDMAKSFGRSDAKHFHNKINVEDPVRKLSTGPVHFAHTGWAFVDIHAESSPSPDENYYLQYDHPYSFEADSWINSHKKTTFCTCFMSAGYSAGWCETSFGIQLDAKEILCRAKGDTYCRFIMSQPFRLEEFINAYTSTHPELFK